MIKFTEGGLEDIWPQKTPRIQAISYAMQQAMKMVKKYADKSRCYAAVDELSEEILDYFAVEMRLSNFRKNTYMFSRIHVRVFGNSRTCFPKNMYE